MVRRYPGEPTEQAHAGREGQLAIRLAKPRSDFAEPGYNVCAFRHKGKRVVAVQLLALARDSRIN